MARSSNSDPLERFRFSVSIITIDLSVTGALETLAAFTGQNTFAKKKLAVMSRAGFSDVTLPKANVNVITYRENIDNQRFSKSPGLTTYEPVILRRGVTDNRDLYNWYRQVNDDMALLGVAQELIRDAKVGPQQSENFRKEVIITAHNRKGEPVKQWFLFNAFPVSYKGGNDLSASADQEKLVEELTLDYEFFLELEGGLSGFGKEIARDALEGVAGALINQVPFLR